MENQTKYKILWAVSLLVLAVSGITLEVCNITGYVLPPVLVVVLWVLAVISLVGFLYATNKKEDR